MGLKPFFFISLLIRQPKPVFADRQADGNGYALFISAYPLDVFSLSKVNVNTNLPNLRGFSPINQFQTFLSIILLLKWINSHIIPGKSHLIGDKIYSLS